MKAFLFPLLLAVVFGQSATAPPLGSADGGRPAGMVNLKIQPKTN